MTTYTWPGTDSAFNVARMTWRQRHNSRSNTSELNGASQGISLPGARWGLTLDFPRQTYAERARVEGFFNRLSGIEHRAAIWDLARPSPTLLAGSPLVNGALAQFATTMAVDGSITTGVNRLRYSQELDNAVWAKSNATVTANATAAPNGATTADKIVETVTGATTHSVNQAVTGFNAGETVAFSVYVKAAERTWAMVRVMAGGALATTAFTYVDLSTGAAGSNSNLVDAPVVKDAGGGWWRVTIVVLTTGAGSLAPAVFAAIANSNNSQAGDGTSGIYAWGAQLQLGRIATDYTGLPSLTPGDWLSLPLTGGGNQVVQVVNSTVGETLTGVEFRPSLRAAVADNAAITIVQPAALFRLADPSAVDFPRAGSFICPEMSVELVEEFT